MYYITSFFTSAEPVKPTPPVDPISEDKEGSFVELEFCGPTMREATSIQLLTSPTHDQETPKQTP
jgi:hypothetical protein